MKTATRCCTCGDEIAPGSDVWRGSLEDGTACSMLCRYKQRVALTNGWSNLGWMRVVAAKEALLHDPEIFGENEVAVCVLSNGDPAWAGTTVLEANEKGVVLEIVAGEWEGDMLQLGWDDLLDVQVRDA